jgi:hypothetical protein
MGVVFSKYDAGQLFIQAKEYGCTLTPYTKINLRNGSMAEVVECLLSKHEDLSSISSMGGRGGSQNDQS